jgi:hypothetical protein
MDQLSSRPQFSADRSHDRSQQIITIARCDRWQAYYRLQELQIPCICLEDGRLQVEVNTPNAAIQLWSVMQQLTRTRQQLSDWLERCWQL